MKKSITITGILVLTTFLIIFMNLDESESTKASPEIEKSDNLNNQVKKLTVGGNPTMERHTSNTYLNMTHRTSAAITLKSTFGYHDKPIDKKMIRMSLYTMLDSLKYIAENGNDTESLNELIDLTNKALGNKVGVDAEILDEIHSKIHDMDEHYNQEEMFKDIPVDKYGDEIHSIGMPKIS